jgi:hypothetical protein
MISSSEVLRNAEDAQAAISAAYAKTSDPSPDLHVRFQLLCYGAALLSLLATGVADYLGKIITATLSISLSISLNLLRSPRLLRRGIYVLSGG